ncbi:hypothetical protein ITX31_03200 [Arthrobacter gandavensis]|uniref:hypothetical protein n=1 Tax=Arthrobacter gandavensis TaxID=169960 RepID=UPI00188F6DBC|nr:hypothetical protein [Arthrobacter gandavensis]MBF4993119.1 hypothetical protein [Arthrobacter gandavensis]
MRTRTTAFFGIGLALTGSLLLTGCDDPQLPQVPGFEQQEGEEPQDGSPENPPEVTGEEDGDGGGEDEESRE